MSAIPEIVVKLLSGAEVLSVRHGDVLVITLDESDQPNSEGQTLTTKYFGGYGVGVIWNGPPASKMSVVRKES